MKNSILRVRRSCQVHARCHGRQLTGNVGREVLRLPSSKTVHSRSTSRENFCVGTHLRLMDHPATRIAGPLLGLVCAAVFLAGIDAHEVGAAIHGVAWWWLVPVLIFGCVNLWLRAARWGVLLATPDPLPISALLGVGVTAGLAGLGLPARGGDAVKVLLASRLPGVRLADVAAA